MNTWSLFDARSGLLKRVPNGVVLTKRSILLNAGQKKISHARVGTSAKPAGAAKPSAAGMVENIVGCKWSLTVIGLVRNGVNRPGAMEHAVPGLSAKVLNERLRKLVRYGIFEKRAFAEIPPRVEYSLTGFGVRFVEILDQIERLERALSREEAR